MSVTTEKSGVTAGVADLVGQETRTDRRLHGLAELIAQPQPEIRLPPAGRLARTVPQPDPRAVTIRSGSWRLIRGTGRA
jgi:hypothetical protein